MSTTDIQSKIQAAALRLTNEIVAVLGAAFATAVTEVGARAPARPAIGPKAKPVRAAAPAKRPEVRNGKRIRRSDGQLMEVGGQVVQLLQANKKGLRIEQINKMLGTTTRQLSRPILKLLSNRQIRKIGDRRATTYFAG
jgi:hypothetical protein